jgi:hypothetical protein
VIVQKKICVLHLALTAFCVLTLLGSPAYGQGKGKDTDKDTDNDEATEHHEGLVQDWSHHHAVYPRVGPIQSLIAVQNDPRAIQSWQAVARSEWREWNNRRSHHTAKGGMHADWSISLGTGTTAPFMYPAKWGFSVTALPNCANDFVVFPVNVAGGTNQPNIVAFNNLYSGTAPGPTGLCNAGRTPAVGVDDGVSATTYWSYNVSAVGGRVATSPVLSFDGKKVAFVETNSSGPAHFHVLAWLKGEGVATNLQSVTSPVTINSFTAFAPQAGFTSQASDLALGSSPDTLSSPFFEYGTDRAYVGNDIGTLFRIKDVFCLYGTCTANGTPAPSLDGSWPNGGALATGCSGKLTSPVVDGRTGHVFVGCSDGKLYGFTNTGSALTPLQVGNGLVAGGIVDPPLVDGTNGVVYAVCGNNGANSVIVEAKTSDLSLISTATLGAPALKNLHLPAFNDQYFSNVNPASWLLYEVAPTAGGITINGVGFTVVGSPGVRTMNSTPGANVLSFSFGGGTQEASPLTEFVGNGGQDRFFESVQSGAGGNLASFNITPGHGTNNAITGFPTALEHFSSQGTGTTGIVIDNVSTSLQAESIYFGAIGANTAVKLTQSALQ